MTKQRIHIILLIFVIAFMLIGMGCRFLSGASPETAATPTPTSSAVMEIPSSQNRCEGLTGTLELQLLIGPSEAVGLEPFAFASIPFKVETTNGTHHVIGGGPIEYYEDVLEAEWGSFTVTFDGETSLSGECISQDEMEKLDILFQMEGEQIITVLVEGMEMTYPWTGSPSLEASFPLEDGAEIQGEGWLLILHLN